MNRPILFLLLLASSSIAADKPAILKDGKYTMKVTHEVLHPKAVRPGDPIPKDQYKPAKNKEDLRLQLSEKGKKVVILPQGISGKLQSADGRSQTYYLNKGLFAGGSLVIEKTQKGMIATFTEYGSGVPVISSKRGSVAPVVQQKEPPQG